MFFKTPKCIVVKKIKHGFGRPIDLQSHNSPTFPSFQSISPLSNECSENIQEKIMVSHGSNGRNYYEVNTLRKESEK